MEFRQLVVGPLETNCYVLWDALTRKGAIIDPGDDRDGIVGVVESLGLSIGDILLTHGHLDHAFCAGELAARFSARIGMHRADLGHLSEGLGIAALYYDLTDYDAVVPDHFLTDGDELAVGESTISAIHTPGHSEGGLCYRTDIGVFCGDTLFAGSVGRTDFPGGSFEALIRSVKNTIMTMDDATRLYPGHGPPTTVGSERRGNPFLL